MKQPHTRRDSLPKAKGDDAGLSSLRHARLFFLPAPGWVVRSPREPHPGPGDAADIHDRGA